MGLVEYPKDTKSKLALGNLEISYPQYAKRLKDIDFAGHICFDTATEGAKEFTKNDGKPKYGFDEGMKLMGLSFLAKSGPMQCSTDIDGKRVSKKRGQQADVRHDLFPYGASGQ